MKSHRKARLTRIEDNGLSARTISASRSKKPIVKHGQASVSDRSSACAALREAGAWAAFVLVFLLAARPAQAQNGHSFYNSVARHFTYKGGGGLTSPVGGTGAIMNEGWNVTAGAGYRKGQKFSLLIEWQTIQTGMGNGLLRYNLIPRGSYHIWSAGLTPTYNYWHHGKFGSYLLAGGGYSHTGTIYTGPGGGGGAQCYLLCTCYNDCSSLSGQKSATYQTTSNQPMVDAGVGLTMQISGRHRYKLFAEARYENLFQGSDLPPYRNVEFVPLTAGIQW